MTASKKHRRRIIRFYNRNEPYFEFTNFEVRPIVVGGLLWPSSEHYFQAQKFAGTWLEEFIRLEAREPRDAFRLGRCFPARPDWDVADAASGLSEKDRAMSRAVRAKFLQHNDLREMLIGTGDAVLVEHTANDSYWGDGGDGRGRNMLGIILTVVRESLRLRKK